MVLAHHTWFSIRWTLLCAANRTCATKDLCQKPVLVLPHGRIHRITADLPPTVRPRKPPKFASEWGDLAGELLNFRADEMTRRTVKYLLDLASDNLGQELLPELLLHRTCKRNSNLELQRLHRPPSCLRALASVMAFRPCCDHESQHAIHIQTTHASM